MANGVLEFKQKPAAVSIQYNRVLQAFENIILNAAERTSAEGHITIRACYEKDLPHIFDYHFSVMTQGSWEMRAEEWDFFCQEYHNAAERIHRGLFGAGERD